MVPKTEEGYRTDERLMERTRKLMRKLWRNFKNTRQAVAGSRSTEEEVELRVANVDGRKGTEGTVVAGSGGIRKTTTWTVQEQRVISFQQTRVVVVT